jgi:signal transduction histidine kinase
MTNNRKGIPLQNYTLRYLLVALLPVIAIWAGLFYAVITEEVYDNIDDGLKNSKLLIIRETYAHPELLNAPEYGINQYKIEPLPKGSYDFSDTFTSTFEFMEYDDDDEPVRLLQTVFNDAQGNPHRLTIRASLIEEDELLEDLLLALIGLYIMLVVSIALLNRVVLKKAWKAFYALLEKLRLYKPGKGQVFETPDSKVAEFRTLGNELQEMLQRNEDTYASQKQFIENASHELQTPLAVSLNKLELFAENSTLPDAQMAELGKISDTLQRLVRLNKSLLTLSKIDNRQYTEAQPVDFNALTAELLEDFEPIANHRDITITLKTEDNLTYIINRGLAVVLLSNLIKNAIIHNHTGGNITITVAQNSLSVENTGSGKPLDQGLIFMRFYRQGSNEQSTGLGLSLVKSIAESCNIKLDYQYDGNHGFRLVFPQN